MSFMSDGDYRAWAGRMRSPCRLAAADISIIVPVKDNQSGVERFVAEAGRALRKRPPREVIVVDNNSSPPLEIRPMQGLPFGLRVLRCARPGPAAARNTGARAAAGQWLLFTDSDCVPTPTLISGYADRAADRAIGYAGRVVCGNGDCIARYYDSQQIFLPREVRGGDGLPRPQSLITANCLVWRDAFDIVGGFDESFPEAAGEDVDLGLKLWELGALGFARESVAGHEVGDGYLGFRRRFIRYGRGNARLQARHHGLDGKPRPFRPRAPSPTNEILARLQYRYLLHGYLAEANPAHAPHHSSLVSGAKRGGTHVA